MKRRKKLDEDRVRVIKISGQALFEFIYENFIDRQEDFLDVDPLDVMNTFAINFDRNEFVFCAHKSEDANGKILPLPAEINLQKLMENIPDTTPSMYSEGRYREYTKQELIELSK